MNHICVIGNSQVGALRQGYTLLKSPTYSASFWAIPGGGGPYLNIQSNKISVSKELSLKINTDIIPPPTECFDISKFDAILLSGVGIPAIRFTNKTINN
jgi:hypothetical protein